MTYKRKNRCRPNGIYSNCQKHEEPQVQKLKERSKSNFQTRNKITLCDSKIRTQELKIRTQNVQDKHENGFLLC
jgi:hypothetical protein